MPGKVKVKILAGRNLPVMDRGSLTTDAYVEVKLGNVCHKTEVARKTLNPQWNSDWFRFEVDDAELQDEPLQIRIMDYDTYSANDVIGKVYLSLNPLLIPTSLELNSQKSGKGSVMSGWIPVYDTLQGIRGEINLIVKVDLFSDVNKFRQSSCGIQFFCSPCTPIGYSLQSIHGFVEELIVNDDPEYQWIDKIRTPRASNEARQVAFLKLSGQVQRKIGLKAIEMGANTVIAYKLSFDLENDIGVVARGTGTAVTISKIQESQQSHAENILLEEKLRRAKKCIGSDLSNKFTDIYGSNSVLRMSSGQTLKDPMAKFPLHAYSSGDITVLADQQHIKLLLAQEDSRLLEDKCKRFGWKIKPKLFFQKHLKLKDKKHKATALEAHSFSDLTSKDRSNKGSKETLIEWQSLLKTQSPSSANTFNFRTGMVAPYVMFGLDKIVEHDSPLPMETSCHTLVEIPCASAEPMNEQDSMKKKRATSFMTITSISTGSVSSLSSGEDDDEENTSSDFATSETVSMVVKSVLENEHRNLRTSASDTRLSDEIFKSIPMGKFEVVKDSKGHVISDPFIVESSARLEDIQKLLECQSVDVCDWIQPGSTIVPESEVQDYAKHYSIHKLSETIHHLQSQIRFPFHESTGIIHHYNQPGLLETAIATMLIEKLNICEASAGILPNEATYKRNIVHQPVFNEVNKRLCSKISGSTSNNSGIKIHRGSSEPCIRKDYTNSHNDEYVSCMNDTKLEEGKAKRKGSIVQGFKEILHHFGEHTSELVKENFVEKLHKLREKVHRDKSESRKHQKDLFDTSVQTILMDQANLTKPQARLTTRFQSETCKRKSSLIDLKKYWAFSKKPPLELPLFEQKKRLDSEESVGTDSVDTLKNESFGINNTIETNKRGSDEYKKVQIHIKQNMEDDQNCASDVTTIDLNSSSKSIFVSSRNLPTKSLDNSNSLLHAENIVKAGDHVFETNNYTPLNITNQSSLHASSSFTRRNELVSSPFHPRTESISANARPHQTCTITSNSIGRETPSLTGHHRRSSDSDLSITPKGNSLNSSDKLNSTLPKTPIMRTVLRQDNLDMLEYPFLTINKFPMGFIFHLGSTVAARSVKLLERIPNPDEPETRDNWWNELRMEIRSHARAIGCNVVLGYSEVTTITDDVCVLSATGTAAIVNLNYVGESIGLENAGISRKDHMWGSSFEKREGLAEKISDSENETVDAFKQDHLTNPKITSSPGITAVRPNCSMCHIPYSQNSLPFKATMSKCTICKRHKVPDVLIVTIEIPDLIPITGRACLIQAHVCRHKRDLKSEANAKEISDGLPFLEYELHRQLICKLKVKGMNAIFGLKVALAVGERMIVLVATGTAVFLTCLPSPKVPKIVAGNSWTDSAKLEELQKTVQETQERNKEIFQTKINQESEINAKIGIPSTRSDTDDTDTEDELDLSLGNRDSCVLEVDDFQDLALVALIMECNPPDGIYVVNTEYFPGLQDQDVVKHLQMFTQVWRAKIPANQPNSSFSKHFQKLLQSIYFKLRTMIPCVIAGLKFLIELPEADEMQILVTGMAYNFGESSKINKFRKRLITHSISRDGVRRLDDDLIFNLEEDVESTEQHPNLLHTGSLRLRKKSPTRGKNKIARHMPLRERYGVDITPLSFLPGGQVEKYLGNLNFFFIRESTSIRESGGISGFVHSFITEILAMIRAHVSCLGGNAIVSFYMTELMLVDNPHKNQGQCLVSVGGDVVFVSDLLED